MLPLFHFLGLFACGGFAPAARSVESAQRLFVLKRLLKRRLFNCQQILELDL